MEEMEVDESSAAEMLFSAEFFSQLAEKGIEEKIVLMKEIRKTLCNEEFVLSDAVIPELISTCVKFLQGENVTLQYESSWILINSSFKSTTSCKLLVHYGGLPILMKLLRSGCDEIKEQTALVLANLAGQNIDVRSSILENDFLTQILDVFSVENNLAVTKSMLKIVTKLCAGLIPSNYDKVVSCLPIITQLLNHSNGDIVEECCWALSNFMEESSEQIQKVLDYGVCERLIELLGNDNPNIIHGAVRAIGNIVSGSHKQTQIAMNCNLLDKVEILLENSRRPEILKETFWIISQLAAGTEKQLEDVLHTKIYPLVVQILRKSTMDLKKEGVIIIKIATESFSDKQINTLVGFGCIPAVCELLVLLHDDLTLIALNIIKNILDRGKIHQPNPYAVIIEECWGIDKIKFHKYNLNMEIRSLINYIIITYFG